MKSKRAVLALLCLFISLSCFISGIQKLLHSVPVQDIKQSTSSINEKDANDSAVAELQGQFRKIDIGLNKLRQTSKSEELKDLKRALHAYRQDWENHSAPLHSPTVCVVSTWGTCHSPKTGFDKRANVQVKVECQGQPVVLVLCSYNPMNWQISLKPGVDLRRVILYAPNCSTVAGVPGRLVWKSKHGNTLFTDYRSGPRYVHFTEALGEEYRIKPTTFQGVHYYETPFIVGPADSEWRAMNVMNEMEQFYSGMTLYEKEKNYFAGQVPSLFALSEEPYDLKVVFWGNFGPEYYMDTNLSGSSLSYSRLAVNPNNKDVIVYEAGKFSIFHADGWEPDYITMPENLLEIEHIANLSVDSRRDRLLALAGLHEKVLYAYDFKTNQWSGLIRFKESFDGLSGLVSYCEQDDCIYIVKDLDHYDPIREITKYDANGKFLSTVKLSKSLFVCASINQQLISDGDFLVLIDSDHDFCDSERKGRTFVRFINRHTGEVTNEYNIKGPFGPNLQMTEHPDDSGSHISSIRKSNIKWE